MLSLSLSHRLKSFGVGKKMLYGMQPYGIQLQSMLKEGQKDLYGLNEAVLKNIDSCKQLSNITRTSLSPNGTNKMVIDPLDKLYKQMMLPLLTSCSQDFGFSRQGSTRRYRRRSYLDGISFAGELLQNPEELLRMGLHPSIDHHRIHESD